MSAQIVDDYLQTQGYFTAHNVRFNAPKDQNFIPATNRYRPISMLSVYIPGAPGLAG